MLTAERESAQRPRQRDGSLLRYPEDRIPVVIFFTFFAADLMVWAFSKTWWFPVLWCVAGFIPKGWVCSWNHNHQHVNMFKSPFLNRVLELGFALQTGVTTNAWLLHHVLGHHLNYLEPLKDESGWMNPDGTSMGMWEYTWKNTLAAYPRVWQVGGKHPQHRRVFFWGFVTTALVLMALIERHPYNAIFVYVIPMFVSLAGTIWVTWFHHANLPTDNAMVASTNTLDPLYNFFTGNLGYHTAHHYRQALHWSKLPQLHAELEGRIPASTYLEAGFPINWMRKVLGPHKR
ncbi:MAG: fatty acid desaturase [Proteobacteria bacterium]|nr:fatty acid desaturase [Pseudomonadota bacterium]